jgi:acyl-coenzyme A thioesterase PaaI-like protein
VSPIRRIAQPETCFACGTKNPHGLHITFKQTETGAGGFFVPTEHHEGWPGVVHGGILTTLLDEGMAYALWFADIRAVTARMETRFRRTVGAGDELRIAAEVLGRRREIVDAVGTILLRDDSVVAEATARFMLADVSY